MNGVDPNWNILGNALNSNPGQAFTQAFQQGVTQSGMGLAAQGDPRGMNALMAFNPQAGMAMQDRQASQAAAQSQAQLRQAQTVEQQLENRRNDIIMGASFLEGVTDDAGYQAAVQRARSAGVNIEGAPPTFDPNYVGGVRQTAQALLAAQQRRNPNGDGGMTTFQRELAGAGIFPGSPAYAAAIANRNLPPYDVIAPGGRAQQRPGYVDPFSLPGTPPGQQGAPQAPGQPQQPQSAAPANIPPIPQGATPQSLRAMAAEAIQAGADPALVLPALTEHLRQLEGGAAPSNGQGGFPPAIDIWNAAGN